MAQPAKHTPGPWQISAIQNEPEKVSIIDADMCFVAEVWQTYIDGESRQQAHAALIAAAPAMYEALRVAQRYLEQCQGHDEEWQIVTDALAQAEGRHPREEETCE